MPKIKNDAGTFKFNRDGVIVTKSDGARAGDFSELGLRFTAEDWKAFDREYKKNRKRLMKERKIKKFKTKAVNDITVAEKPPVQ